MEQFKVGDRVRSVMDGDEGVITRFEDERVWVDFDIDGSIWDSAEFLELVEPEPALADWEKDLLKNTTFEQNVRRILNGVADTVASKNLAYGDSALNPIRVFSKADRMEQLFVRLDDKLSRVQKGHEYPGDDTIRDIIGYCTLVLIARESQ